MPSAYAVAPIFLIRMAGVPFEAIEALATRQSIISARKVIARRTQRLTAKAGVEEFFRSRKQLLSAEAYHNLRVAVRTDRPPAKIAGNEPAFFTGYASAAIDAESAEEELELTLNKEVSVARAALSQASQKYLEEYVVFAAPSVRDFLAESIASLAAAQTSLPSRNNAARKLEQSLLLYLQRVAAKNDTFSQFGPTGWGTADANLPRLSVVPRDGIAARELFLERWSAHAVAAAMNADPDVFFELAPHVNPNGRIEGEAFLDTENRGKIPLSAEEIEVVKQCNGARPVYEFEGHAGIVRDLIGKSVLRCAVEVPALEPHAFAVLRDDVQNWRKGAAREKWLSLVEPIAQLPEQFGQAREPRQRIEILDQAREALGRLGVATKEGHRFLYSATNPIGEECFRECNFRIQTAFLDRVTTEAADWIDLWRDSYAFVASRVAGGLRRVFEKANPSGEAMPLPAFLQACEGARLPLTGPGLVALAVMAFQEVKAAIREQLHPHLNDSEYQLTRDDCHVVRKRFQYPKFDEYTYPSADLQLAAPSIEALGQGNYQWIISELHPPVAMLHHGFYWSCPDKERLNQALASTVKEQPNFHFGFFAADFTSHTTVRQFDAIPELSNFVAPQRAHPNWKKIPPAEAEVFVDKDTGDAGVRKIGSQEYLGSFARAWVIPLGFHPFQFGFAPHTPRLRCGRVIVQRRSWTITHESFPAGNYHGVSRELVIAVEQIREEKGLPRYVFIRPTEQALRRSGAEGRDKDTKPVFIDLESYLFHEIFHRWLAKAGELEVTEMLPDPENLLWREGDGHHTFELRTLIIPQT